MALDGDGAISSHIREKITETHYTLDLFLLGRELYCTTEEQLQGVSKEALVTPYLCVEKFCIGKEVERMQENSLVPEQPLEGEQVELHVMVLQWCFSLTKPCPAGFKERKELLFCAAHTGYKHCLYPPSKKMSRLLISVLPVNLVIAHQGSKTFCPFGQRKILI